MARRNKKDACCSLSGFLRNPDRACFILTGVGCFLCMVSAFVDRWRVDTVGMRNWEALYGSSVDFSKLGMQTFKEREYGLLAVKGFMRNSWKAQAQTTCTYRDMNALVSLGTSIATIISEWDLSACQDSTTDKCSSSPTVHLSIRCEEYGNMERAGLLTVVFTMISIFLVLASLLAGLQCQKEKVGGVIFGCLLMAGILTVIFNIVWAARSDSSFRRIMESAWYPYPTLAVGYYLHLFGGLFMLTAAIFYGILVLPEVTKYDPLQKAIDRREKRLMDAKVNAAKQQHDQQQQMQGFMMHQQVAPAGVMVQQQVYVQPQPMMVGSGFVQQQQVTTVGGPTMVVQEQQNYQMPAAPPSGF